jgi:hypothetical protein
VATFSEVSPMSANILSQHWANNSPYLKQRRIPYFEKLSNLCASFAKYPLPFIHKSTKILFIKNRHVMIFLPTPPMIRVRKLFSVYSLAEHARKLVTRKLSIRENHFGAPQVLFLSFSFLPHVTQSPVPFSRPCL